MKRRTFLLIIIFSLLLALGGCDHIFHYSYSIEGVISVEDTDKTLADVSIHLEGENVDEIITTDKGGKFQATRLEGEITLTPVKNGWDFSPGSYTVSSSDKELDFMASPAYYQAEGRITYEDGQGASDVKVYFSGFESVTTDDSGYWTSGDLRGTVEVTPVKEGYTFEPAKAEVSEENKDVDFTATDKSYTVKGRVKLDDEGLADVEIAFSGKFENVTTNSGGYWTKEGLMGTVKVSPAKEGYTFNPSEVEVSEANEEVNFTAFERVYSIEGKVLRDLDDDQSGIPGVEMIIETEDDEITVKTSSTGSWSREGLRGPVDITPELNGWTFDPANFRAYYGKEGLNEIVFEGTPEEVHEVYEVSGRIQDVNGNGIPSILINFEKNGKVIGTAITDTGGEWSKERLWGKVDVVPMGVPPHYNETFVPTKYTVSAAESNVNFIMVEDVYEVSGTIQDEEGNGIPSILIEFEKNGEVIGTAITKDGGDWTKDGLWGEVTVRPRGIPPYYDEAFVPSYQKVNEARSDVDFVLYDAFERAYSIEGKVLRDLDDDKSGIHEVEMIIKTDDDEITVKTSSTGSWSREGLRGFVGITPEFNGWTFDPTHFTAYYGKEGLNEIVFEGTPEDVEVYGVSGKIQDEDGTGISSILIEFEEDDEVIGTAITKDGGDWTKERLWGEVTVTPRGSHPDYEESFDPSFREVNEAKSDVDFELD